MSRKEAIVAAFEELRSMPEERFKDAMERSRDSDVYAALQYSTQGLVVGHYSHSGDTAVESSVSVFDGTISNSTSDTIVVQGKKFDSGKPDLSLIPLIAQEQEAYAFMLGEKKYGRYNYCAGLDSHRLIAAALRHISQWQNGEEQDSESGYSHLGHARACLAMLLHCQQLGTLKDTRRK